MYPPFQANHLLLRKQVFALTGVFRIYDDAGQVVAYSKQKMFKLREDIRVYTNEDQSHELMIIQARNIIDFSAAYDVYDCLSGTIAGTLRRRGIASIVRDEWDVLDANGMQIGTLIEDSTGQALLRRFLVGSLLPQNYDVIINGQPVMDLRQRFNLFRYELDLDFSMDTQRQMDHRLGVAAAILLGAIEGKQDNG